MTHFYLIYITEETKQTSYRVSGVEAAYHAYVAAREFVEAVGLDAVVELVDGETAEILADTRED